jgi:EAL and modified HD-GYP domain-containing signal transduction protein
MDISVSDPLVLLHLLADRNGKFAAFRIVAEPGGEEVLSSYTEQADFLGLGSQIPCLYCSADNAPLSVGLASALSLAGCKLVFTEQIGHADQMLIAQYPDEVEWIEGNWYLKPSSKPKANQSISRALALQLVQLVAADADNREIEDVFRHDPALSYQLLRLVNSLAVGAGRRITSFSQAIVMLGRKQLRRWLNLMVFASREEDHRSTMLLANVAIRARSMELLARAAGLDVALQDQAFIAGMFSLLGVLFGMPLEEVLRPLQISDAMRSGLLMRTGELGNLLGILELNEHDGFDTLRAQLDAMAISASDFNLISVQACNWMLGVVRESTDGHHG